MYTVDDYIRAKEQTVVEATDNFIDIFYQLGILEGTYNKYGKLTKKDSREAILRNILSRCHTEIQVGNIVHDVMCGNKTLNQLIKEYEQ